VAGTPLKTPGGWKPIEAFCPGDLVLSRNENDPDGPVEVKVVEEVFVGEGLVWNLHVDGQVIQTTAEHPFYVKDRGWLPTNRLRVGDHLATEDGRWAQVEDLLDTGEWAALYNFRVADHHTYFVGCDAWGFSVWAHNACVALGLRGGLADFARRTGGKPYWEWRAAGLTQLPVEPKAAFPAAFADATANAEWIFFDMRVPFSAERALNSPEDWLADDNVTNMEYKSIVFNAALIAKTSFVP
jgi:hypothetical protein